METTVNVDPHENVSNYLEVSEKKLTHIVLCLAGLEKTGKVLSDIAFGWATFFVIGSYGYKLNLLDFWLIVTIVFINGFSLFCRVHELKWQKQSSLVPIVNLVSDDGSEGNAGSYGGDDGEYNEMTRYCMLLERLCIRFFSTTIMIRINYWLYTLSSLAIGGVTLSRLISQKLGFFKEYDTTEDNQQTRVQAMIDIFYILEFLQAIIFLIHQVYFEYRLRCGFDLPADQMIQIIKFFNITYSKCIQGSIYDAQKMNMVSFSKELLASDIHNDQLMGAKILLRSATQNRFPPDRLEMIGSLTSTTGVTTIERLVDMLNCNETEVRLTAAKIVLYFISETKYAGRLTGIPRYMESISSLLFIDDSNINFLGLQILNKLSHHHHYCCKIASTKGLLQKIIEFIDTIEITLELLKKVASIPEEDGKIIRQKMSDIPLTISKFRDVLLKPSTEYRVILQKLYTTEILTSLAMEKAMREKIGRTGGIIPELLSIHLDQNSTVIRAKAGEALIILTMESKSNCKRILKLEEQVNYLVSSFNNELTSYENSAKILRNTYENSAKILRNICACLDPKARGFESIKHSLSSTLSMVIRRIMAIEYIPSVVEASMGLAIELLNFVTPDEATKKMMNKDLAKKLVSILRSNRDPCIDFPGLRRFAIQMAIWMMKSDEKSIAYFRDEGLREELEKVEKNSSEVESFPAFDGNVGIFPYPETMESLVEDALRESL